MDEDDEAAVTRDHIELSNVLDLYLMESAEYQAPNALGAPFDILLW